MQPIYKRQPFLLRNNKMNPSSNRYSKAVFILIILILLWTPEAYVSEVVFEDNGTRTEEDLRKLSAESSLIVILHDTQELEKIKEVTFPKETHYLQSHTTQYIEYAQIYKVKKVLKHTSPGSIEKRLKAGDTIRVLRKNEFSEL
ncbi:MAG TPA: hypothetical protein VN030_02175, partial [Cellvibrio sp.]|nr:hypothetical protein [Cellvibrio sp.]